MKLSKYAVVLAGVGMTASLAQAGNIPIVNGDFGLPTQGGNFTTINAGNSFDGWNVTSGSIDLIGTYWPASPGNGSGQSVDMDGNNPGTIQQTGLALGVGTATVTFDLNGNHDGGNPIKTLQVDLIGPGGPLAAQTFTYDTSASRSWIVGDAATFNIPTAGNYTLQFASLDDSSSPYGPALDNVSMNEVVSTPDGVSTAGLFGLGLVGLGWFRRKIS